MGLLWKLENLHTGTVNLSCNTAAIQQVQLLLLVDVVNTEIKRSPDAKGDPREMCYPRHTFSKICFKRGRQLFS